MTAKRLSKLRDLVFDAFVESISVCSELPNGRTRDLVEAIKVELGRRHDELSVELNMLIEWERTEEEVPR